MKLLAFDIGTGTKDVLLYDSERLLENCIKMVVSSPTVVSASRLDEWEGDCYIDGDIVGGGPLTHAALRHMKKGNKLIFSESAANAVKNTPKRVQEMGLVIGDNPGFPVLRLDELQLDNYFNFLETLNEKPKQIEAFLLAVQDHGRASDEETDRSFRFTMFLDQLAKDPTLDAFTYTQDDLPECFMRMHSSLRYVRERYPWMKVLFLDTCIAALRGCIASDPAITGPTLVLNVGNSHSMAAVLQGNRIVAFFEHHTRMMKKDPQKYVHYLTKLVAGDLTNQEVFDDGGEGCFVFEKVGVENLQNFLYTGPRRGIIESLDFPFQCKPRVAAPGGDMMMTGPVGLVEAYYRSKGEPFKLK